MARALSPVGRVRGPAAWGRPGPAFRIGSTLMGLAVGLAAACRDQPDAELVFRAAAVEQRGLAASVDVTGHLRARSPRVVTAPRPGRLVEVRVTAGATVTAGQTLARLDDASAARSVARQRSLVAGAAGRLEHAEAHHREARQALDRARTLRARGQLSEAELEAAVATEAAARASVRIAQAERAGAQQDLGRARDELQQSTIVAPESGVVLSVPDELGVPVTPEGPRLFRLAAPLHTLALIAEVGEADIARLAPDQPVQFEVQAYPGEWFSADIDRIGVLGQRNEGVATYTVELTAPNQQGRLRPGMTAAVRFEVGRERDALVVPEAALRFVPTGAPEAPARSRVFRLKGPRSLEVVPVASGVSDGAFTAVQPRDPGTLSPGDRVVIGVQGGAGQGSETNISLSGGGS